MIVKETTYSGGAIRIRDDYAEKDEKKKQGIIDRITRIIMNFNRKSA